MVVLVELVMTPGSPCLRGYVGLGLRQMVGMVVVEIDPLPSGISAIAPLLACDTRQLPFVILPRLVKFARLESLSIV